MIAHQQNIGAIQTSEETPPCHPLFKTPAPPDITACLDAIDQAAYVVELFGYLELNRDHEGGLSLEAQNGYYGLSAMVSNTLLYASSRLSTLHRERIKAERKNSRYLAALSKSLSALNHEVQDSLLNAIAAEVDATRADVDEFLQCINPK